MIVMKKFELAIKRLKNVQSQLQSRFTDINDKFKKLVNAIRKIKFGVAIKNKPGLLNHYG